MDARGQIQNVCDARRQHARLAGSGAGEHQHRPIEYLDRLPLLRVEVGEIGRGASAERARGIRLAAGCAG